MSLLWQLAWGTVGQETKQEMVNLAREGEALLRALGHATPVVPTATQLSASSDGGAVSDWVDAYDPAATQAGGMPVSVLWAGQHWLDPRADAILMRLGATTPPEWATLVQTAAARTPPAGVNAPVMRNLLDWWAARGRSLASGNEQQQAGERYARAWWAEQLARWTQTPAPVPGVPPVPPPPGTPPAEGGGGAGVVLLALAAAVAFGRRRRR